MEYALVLFAIYVAWWMHVIERNQLKLVSDVAELNERIQSLSEVVENSIQSIRSQLGSLAEDLTTDDVKIKNLVKMGFAESDAWDYVKLGGVGGPPSIEK